MNKIKTIILAVLGGIDTVIYMFTPIILAAIWITIAGLDNWMSYFFYGLGLLATLFRAIKSSGFLKDPELMKDIMKKI
ncbi:MAG TPA: hypothetical protein VMZ91_16005 [Candidatus Paceibacterota bacterium]|nr:hypothetical protein [Candidatus Paceibacterota bacterium]